MPLSEDIVERKRTEEALRNSVEEWRSIFENSAIGAALTDLNGCFVAANPVYQAMVGYAEEQLQEISFLHITHEDYRASQRALTKELLERKRQQFQIESQHRRKDGSSIWVRNSVSLIPGFENVPQFILTLSEDITERKRAEAALRDAEEFKNRLIASSEDCIKMLDLEGRLLRMNEGNALSTGCSSLSNTAKLPSTKPLSLLPANAAQVFTPISLPTSPPWCIFGFPADHHLEHSSVGFAAMAKDFFNSFAFNRTLGWNRRPGESLEHGAERRIHQPRAAGFGWLMTAFGHF
jgi:PAS domain S-box-containing protein